MGHGMARNKQLICLRDQARSLRHIGTTGNSVNVLSSPYFTARCVFFASPLAGESGADAAVKADPDIASLIRATLLQPGRHAEGRVLGAPQEDGEATATRGNA